MSADVLELSSLEIAVFNDVSPLALVLDSVLMAVVKLTSALAYGVKSISLLSPTTETIVLVRTAVNIIDVLVLDEPRVLEVGNME